MHLYFIHLTKLENYVQYRKFHVQVVLVYLQ